MIEIDGFAALFCLFAIGLFAFLKTKLSRNQIEPNLTFSCLSYLESCQKTIKERLHRLPTILLYSTALLFILGIIDIHLLKKNSSSFDHSQEIPVEGVAIYLLLDQSGSMQGQVPLNQGSTLERISKIDLLKRLTVSFIQERQTDLIGLISFARVPRVISPLTLDHLNLIKKVEQLEIVTANEEDGTAIGYAIFKAIHLISSTKQAMQQISEEGQKIYQMKEAVAIIVTDGMQDPNALDRGNRLRTMELEEAFDFAKKEKIKVYWINIDQIFAHANYAPHRRQLEKLTKSTGGTFYLATDGNDFKNIYEKINALEKTRILSKKVVTQKIRSFSLYPYLILAGMACFFFSSFLESFYFKKIP